MISKQLMLSVCVTLTTNIALASQFEETIKPRPVKSYLKRSNGEYLTYLAENRNGMLIAEDDILLGQAQSNSLYSNRSSITSISSNKWFDGIIPYQFSTNVSDQKLIDRTQKAIDTWNKESSIQLVERTSTNAPYYKDYINFTLASSCASYIGRISGEQEIWISPSCSTGSIIHEIGHSLGLLHEHTRFDRDQFITVNYDNIVSDKLHNFDIPSSNISADQGIYDYGSIMHYGEYFFSQYGNPTITPINDTTGIDVGQRNRLSKGDLAGIDALYATDLSLAFDSPDTIVANSTININAFITNQGVQGANSLLLTIPVSGSYSLVNFDGKQWQCEQQDTKILCALPWIIENTQSHLTLTLNIGYQPPDKKINASLSSKTWDTDLSNNGLIIEDMDINQAQFPEPMLGNATASREDPEPTNDDSGSGSIGILSLIGLLLVMIRRKVPRPFSSTS